MSELKSTLPPDLKEFTTKCNVCKQERKASQVRVTRQDVSLYFELPASTMTFNVFYCHDNKSCADKANDIQSVIDMLTEILKGKVNE